MRALSSTACRRLALQQQLLRTHETIHAHHDAFLRLDASLGPVGRLVDLVLVEAGLDRRDGTPHRIDLLDDLDRQPFEFIGEVLDRVGAGQRVDEVGDARLVGDDLLGPQRQRGGLRRRQAERLVVAVRVERLGAAQHRGQRLQGDPANVDQRLLRLQRDAGGLRVEPERPGPVFSERGLEAELVEAHGDPGTAIVEAASDDRPHHRRQPRPEPRPAHAARFRQLEGRASRPVRCAGRPVARLDPWFRRTLSRTISCRDAACE